LQTDEIIGSGKSYKYRKEWVLLEDMPESKTFKDKTYDENRRPRGLHSEVFLCSFARIGPYKIEISELEHAFGWKVFTSLFKYDEPIARIDSDGIWSYEESTHCLIRQKVPGEDNIGDLKVTWFVLNADFDDTKKEVQMSACGVAKDDRLERFEELTRTACENYTSKQNFIKAFAK